MHTPQFTYVCGCLLFSHFFFGELSSLHTRTKKWCFFSMSTAVGWFGCYRVSPTFFFSHVNKKANQGLDWCERSEPTLSLFLSFIPHAKPRSASTAGLAGLVSSMHDQTPHSQKSYLACYIHMQWCVASGRKGRNSSWSMASAFPLSAMAWRV